MHFSFTCKFCFVAGGVRSRTPANIAMEIFEQHQGTHILQVKYVLYLHG